MPRPGPRTEYTLSGRKTIIEAELRSSLTVGAFAQLPLYALSGRLQDWFERYVYTERVRELIPEFRLGQRIAIAGPAALTVSTFYLDLYMVAKPSTRPFVYRPATATFRWIVERVFTKRWLQAINLGLRANAHWARRLAMKGVVQAIPYVGWVLNGALVYLDYQLVRETWRSLYELRDSLIKDIVEQVT